MFGESMLFPGEKFLRNCCTCGGGSDFNGQRPTTWLAAMGWEVAAYQMEDLFKHMGMDQYLSIPFLGG